MSVFFWVCYSVVSASLGIVLVVLAKSQKDNRRLRNRLETYSERLDHMADEMHDLEMKIRSRHPCSVCGVYDEHVQWTDTATPTPLCMVCWYEEHTVSDEIFEEYRAGLISDRG